MKPALEPVRRRIAAWYLGTIAVILLLLGALVYVRLGQEMEEEIDERLTELVDETTRLLRLHAAAGRDLASAATRTLAELERPGRALYIVRPDGTALGGGSIEPDVAAAALRAAGNDIAAAGFTDRVGDRWRVLARSFVFGDDADNDRVVIVALADPSVSRLSHLGLLEVFAVAGLAALLLAAGAGLQLMRVSLRPVETAFAHRQRFLAEAAHELRTPVAVLRGTLDVALARQRDADDDEHALRDAAREVARLNRLVDDLFLLARAEAGERPLRREPCFLDDIVAEAVAAGGVLARERGVELTLDGYEEAPIHGDPDLLRQLALALIDNALKFSPAGGRVRVCVGLEDGVDGGVARMIVEDTGPGVQPADVPRIFERFFRAKHARADTSGAGLGLTIARWIADQHDAVIDVGRADGGGARFTVRMPVRA